MPALTVHKLCEIDRESLHLLEEFERLRDRIRRRAYEFYEARANQDGSCVDDWLRAEQEICWMPQEDFEETDRAVHVVIDVRGVVHEMIEVTLMPEMLILRGASENEIQRGAESHESRSGALLRQICFPSRIHTESAVVRLEADQLKVLAAKVESA